MKEKLREHVVIDDGTSVYPIHISELNYLEIEEGFEIIDSFDNIDIAFECADKNMIGRYD